MAFAPFLKRALWSTRYGIKVVPSYKGYKFCAITGMLHQATTDRTLLQKWNAEDATYNVIAVPTYDSVCIVDADSLKALATYPHQLPKTLRVKTPHEGEHLYFRPTAKSRALGNADVKRIGDFFIPDEKGKLTCLIELKSQYKTAAAPGSLNEDGISYKPIEVPDGLELPCIPDEFVDFIAAHCAVSTGASSADLGFRTPHPDFEAEEFIAHMKEQGIEFGDPIPANAQGCDHAEVYVPTVGCFYKGSFHEQSTRTGIMFYYNAAGELIGANYKCLAGSCEGHEKPSLLDLEDLLEEQGDYQPYPYHIYEDEDGSWIFNVKGVTVEYDELPDSFRRGPGEEEVVAVAVKPPSAYTYTPPEEIPGAIIDPVTVNGVTTNIVTFANEEEDDEVPTFVSKKSKKQDEEPEAEPEEEDEDRGIELSFRKTENGTYRFKVRPLSDFNPDDIEWLWEQRVPLGMVTLWTGKSDCWKTSTLLDISARVTTGRDFPGAKNTLGGAKKVLYAASEDDPAITLRPRMMAAGADCSMVYIQEPTEFETESTMKGKKGKTSKKPFNLSRDLPLLRTALKADPEIKLLVIDPLTSFFGSCDINKDSDMRPLMDSLTKLARDTGVAIIGLIHSNKRSDVGSSIEKVAGATSVAASVRAIWGFSRDPDDKTQGRMALVKSNVIKNRKGYSFSTEDVKVHLPNGKVSEQFKIVWGEELDADADTLMHEERQKARDATTGGGVDATKVVMVKALLQQILPIAAADVFSRVKSEIGVVSAATVYRARDDLKVFSKPNGKRKWWYLPGQDDSSTSKEVELLQMMQNRDLEKANEFALEM